MTDENFEKLACGVCKYKLICKQKSIIVKLVKELHEAIPHRYCRSPSCSIILGLYNKIFELCEIAERIDIFTVGEKIFKM